ncbi:L-threonine ammonia-lyase [Tessaracoccus bendigoensis DSM 12906]|uniref:L-threonine dehydratase n=1 Tax=Tessaracoccus bendigoensis DSM 12906 TaxID=1123357 RepID=A0A1M6MIG5_9ACTN|nr:threonine ammonia-lyase IlvA [Tessaracoccus bendigoensis]SHJ83218.1 L-threonine ammonia-lyase [Tessaracoccus bendigoensis DSM 12906]
MTILTDLADLIPEAVQRLRGVVTRTPVHVDQRLTHATGSEVWLKREDLQPVRSYKLRGAYNLMSQLTDEERATGVICASAGNHGQGVAYSAAALGIKATVVVPRTTPRQKRQRIWELGRGQVELVLHGATYDEASEEASRMASNGGVLVPAFNDARTAAGQATLIVESFEQLGFVPDVVMIPIGGGGLVSGAAAWLRQHHPGVRLIGVEPDGAPCVAAAISAGRPVTLSEIDTFVDGAAVRRVGDFTFEVIREARIELIRVPEGQICSEMLDMYQTDGIIAEPAGALATAALPTGGIGPRVQIAAGSSVLAVVSGGNNDVSRYAEIVERSLIHEGRKHYFLVDFPQQPGALRAFLDRVLGPDDDIAYFEYVKRNARETGPALVGVELGNPTDYPFLLQRIKECGMHVTEVAHDSPFFRFLT